MPVTAKLPPEIAAGATLKLKVKEVTAERVWMQIDPQQPQQATAANPLIGQMTPQAQLQPHVEVEEPPTRRQGADGEPADVVSLAFTLADARAVSTCVWSCAGSVFWPR